MVKKETITMINYFSVMMNHLLYEVTSRAGLDVMVISYLNTLHFKSLGLLSFFMFLKYFMLTKAEQKYSRTVVLSNICMI